MSTLAQILDASFVQYRKHFWKYALFSLVALLGAAAPLLYNYAAPLASGAAQLWILVVLTLLIMIFLTAWGYACMTLSALYPEAPISEVFNFTLSRLAPYAWIAVLTALVTALGYFLLIVPGIFFTAWFLCASFLYFESQTAGRAKISGTSALLASRQLAKGQVLKIFGLFIFIAIFTAIIYGIIAEFLLLAMNPWLSLAWNTIFTLLSVPLILVYTRNIYELIKKNGRHQAANQNFPRSSKALIILAAILGAIIYATLVLYLLSNGGI